MSFDDDDNTVIRLLNDFSEFLSKRAPSSQFSIETRSEGAKKECLGFKATLDLDIR